MQTLDNHIEIIRTQSTRIACDGGGGALGHPRVWLTLGEDGAVVCPYCSRKFIKIGSPADSANSAPDQAADSPPDQAADSPNSAPDQAADSPNSANSPPQGLA